MVLLRDRAPAVAPSGQRAARASLRAQIARLERELAGLVADAFPEEPVPGPRTPPTPATGPHLATLGELEAIRDTLADRVVAARRAATAREARHDRARALLADMYANPLEHRWVRLRASELGERHCGTYHVRPRLGLLGMLMGWWEVKVSSGCPLARPHTIRAHGQAQP